MGQRNKKTKRKTKGKAKFKMVTSPLSNAIVNGDLKKVKDLLKKEQILMSLQMYGVLVK